MIWNILKWNKYYHEVIYMLLNIYQVIKIKITHKKHKKMEESNLKNYEIRSSTTLYSIHKLIGKGRFSRVYQATDTFTNNTVVIKKLINLNIKRKSDRFLYLKELDLLKKLKVSPFRSRYVELRDLIVLSSGGICFVMERLGTTLQAVIHNKGRLPLSMCRLIIRQLAQGKHRLIKYVSIVDH